MGKQPDAADGPSADGAADGAVVDGRTDGAAGGAVCYMLLRRGITFHLYSVLFLTEAWYSYAS